MSNQNGTDLLTPVGRLVQGDCFIPNEKDAQGNPLVTKSGPNVGQARKDYFTAIAIPKTDAAYPALQQLIYNVALAAWPSLFDAQGQCIAPGFAWKLTDGDSQVPNTRGKKPCDFEGFPGHWVLNFSTGYAPKCCVMNPSTGLRDNVIGPDDRFNRGNYIRIYGRTAGNNSPDTPGIYLNSNQIEFVGYGTPIISGPSADAAFGAAPALPAGASATPVAAPGQVAAPAAAAGVPAAPVAVNPTPGPMTAATPAPVAAPAAQVQPAPSFLNGPAAAATAPAPPPATPADTGQRRTPDGGVYTRAQLVASGWTEDAINALPAV